jgi:RNA-binding protein PNO1
MPAPTALLQRPENNSEPAVQENDGSILLDPSIAAESEDPIKYVEETSMDIDAEGAPLFPPSSESTQLFRVETRKIPVPPHRFSPLKASWPRLYPPLVDQLRLQCRMNVKTKSVELRTSKHTTDTGALQKGEDFIKAFCLGFDLDDAIARKSNEF